MEPLLEVSVLLPLRLQLVNIAVPISASATLPILKIDFFICVLPSQNFFTTGEYAEYPRSSQVVNPGLTHQN
jgi:hypothetical protein